MAPVTESLREAREWGLVVATARLDRGRRAHESRAGLTTADNRLLWLLTSEGPRTMREISQALGLEQSTVNRQVNASLERGLVERVERPGEAARVVRITDAGATHFTAELKRGMGLFEQALAVLPEAERSPFVEHLLAFADAYRVAADEALEAHQRDKA